MTSRFSWVRERGRKEDKREESLKFGLDRKCDLRPPANFQEPVVEDLHVAFLDHLVDLVVVELPMGKRSEKHFPKKFNENKFFFIIVFYNSTTSPFSSTIRSCFFRRLFSLSL